MSQMKGLVILRCAVLLKLFSKKKCNLGGPKNGNTELDSARRPGGFVMILPPIPITAKSAAFTKHRPPILGAGCHFESKSDQYA
jgi:hypothetical protein